MCYNGRSKKEAVFGLCEGSHCFWSTKKCFYDFLKQQTLVSDSICIFSYLIKIPEDEIAS